MLNDPDTHFSWLSVLIGKPIRMLVLISGGSLSIAITFKVLRWVIFCPEEINKVRASNQQSEKQGDNSNK